MASRTTPAFVDNIEAGVAVLLLGEGGETECRVPEACLPEGAGPGTSLRLTLKTDSARTKALLRDVAASTDRLSGRGGKG